MPGSWILAVDFGTTNTAAAIRFADGRLEKVKLDPGSDTMPSAVVMTEGQWRVGHAALNARWTHPQTFVGSPKTRLGQEPMMLGNHLVDPAQIASVVLAAVRERASAAAGGGAPDRLVLTHPARWGDVRLSALREAARLGGFPTDSVRLLPEPIAALHAHVQPGSLPPGSRVAVVDTGGGTCDVAVLHVTDNPAPGKDLLVVAQEGDERLGGNDLDGLLYQWVLSQLGACGRTDLAAALQDPAHMDAAMALLDMVRAAKQDLSEHADAPIAVSVAGHKATLTITRDEYEKLIAEPITRAADLTARALAASGTTALAGLYLTGGTAYTPALARALHHVTGILTAPIGDPKLVVAIGALKTPTAVMKPTELHQLTQQLKADRIQQALTRTNPHDPTTPAPQPTNTAPQPTNTEPTPPQPPDNHPQPPTKNPRPNRKILIAALTTIIIAATAGILWIVRLNTETCWDGTSGGCSAFAGSDAVEYAFSPSDPKQCKLKGSNVESGLFYEADCSPDRRYKPYTADLLLWADMDAIAAFMDDKYYESKGTWKNNDGQVVGTTYTPKNSYSSEPKFIRCYDEIPLCLRIDEEFASKEFKTLSADKIKGVAAWIATHSIPDPTASWDPEAVTHAFPPADGSDPLTCTAGDLSPNNDQSFSCEWPDSSTATVTRFRTANEAIQYFSENDDVTKSTWKVDGVERGTVFSEGNLEGDKRYCYADAPYCIRLNDHPDDLMKRIEPLTKEQASKL